MRRNVVQNMWLTLFGKSVSQIGSKLYGFAMSFYILKITGSGQSFALSLILTTLPSVILSPFVGNLADRVSKKAIVVVSDLLSGLLMLAIYLMTLQMGLTLPMIYTATFLLAIFYTFLSTAYTSAYANIVTPDYLTKIGSYNHSLDSFISIFVPVVGGALYALIDPKMFLLINGISFILSAISELFIDFKFNYQEAKRDKVSFMTQMKEGITYVKGQKLFMTIAFYALCINFFLSSINLIMPYNLVTVHGFSPTAMGIVEAAFPVGALLMSIVVGMKNIAFSKKIFGNCMLIIGLTLILFALPVMPFLAFNVPLLPYYFGIMIVFAGITIILNVPLGVMLQLSIDEAYRGRAFGLLGALTQAVVPLAFLLTGFLINFIPSYIMIGVVSLMMVIFSLSIHNNAALGSIAAKEEDEDLAKV